jgi:hypothetical protein
LRFFFDLSLPASACAGAGVETAGAAARTIGGASVLNLLVSANSPLEALLALPLKRSPKSDIVAGVTMKFTLQFNLEGQCAAHTSK